MDFIAKLKQQIKPYADQDNYLSNTKFVNAVKLAIKLKAEIIGVNSSDIVGPTLVCDFTHDQFGGCEPTGLVTLHTFRTAKEAINLVSKETINFSNASIWHENHAYAYELVAELKLKNFYINCYHVPTAMLDESASQGKSFVVMDKSYHYETVPCNGIQKSIVFPYGSIFAN